ncbi:Pyridoxamine 5'-phosphate oxidase [uncultured archaeon]|nr:Pyridoxamine 5'-phosphate oxidase [uncultured archaeon]
MDGSGLLRRKEKAMSEVEAKSFLASMNTGVLSLSSSDVPYAVPIHLVFVEDENAAYFHGASEGQKHLILKSNPTGCLIVFNEKGIKDNVSPCKTGTHYESVIVKGAIQYVNDPTEKAASLSNFVAAKTGKTIQFLPADVKGTCVMKLSIREITGKRS